MSDQKNIDHKHEYENLILEGGGVLGYAYVGAIKALDELDALKTIKRFAGTSIGSVFAALLCIGLSSTEIELLTDNLSFKYLYGNNSISDAYKVWNNLGVNNMSKLEKQLRHIIKHKVDPDINLKNLYKITNKELVIVTCCLNRETPVYLHHAKFPNVSLITALLCSISIPIVFQPQKHTFFGTEDLYVDGGLVDNYPIWIFNDIKKLYDGELYETNKDDINPKTLGLKLLSASEKNNHQVFTGRNKIKNINTMLGGIVNTLLVQIERAHISKSYIKQTVKINTGDISFVDFDISKKKISFLKHSGYTSVKTYYKVDT